MGVIVTMVFLTCSLAQSYNLMGGGGSPFELYLINISMVS